MNEKEVLPKIDLIKEKTIVCACAEGEERSVLAQKLLREKGFTAKLLPGGLEVLQDYILGKSEDMTKKMTRLLARGENNIRKLRVDHNSEYNQLLRLKDAVWLIFIGRKIEVKKFNELITQLKNAYGIEIHIVESFDEKTVQSGIEKILTN